MFNSSKEIKAFWSKNNGISNFGDELTPYLIRSLTDFEPKYTEPKRFSFSKTYFLVGSILMGAKRNCVIWGSGIVNKSHGVAPAKFVAVRGPETRKRLLELGYKVPEVYGDPGLLMPRIFFPKVEKKYDLGIIPHYVDYEYVEALPRDEGIKIINLQGDIETVITDILSCRATLSSSLHGIIESHAYQIPCLWFKFSENIFGDSVKYHDYLKSVGIKPYEAFTVNLKRIKVNDMLLLFEKNADLSVMNCNLQQLTTKLLNVCPFRLKRNLIVNDLNY